MDFMCTITFIRSAGFRPITNALQLQTSFKGSPTSLSPCNFLSSEGYVSDLMTIFFFSIEEVTRKWPQNNCFAVCSRNEWTLESWYSDSRAYHSYEDLKNYGQICLKKDLSIYITDISCFLNLVKTWRLGKNQWELVCWKETWEGWEGELGKLPADLLHFDSKKPMNGSLHELC